MFRRTQRVAVAASVPLTAATLLLAACTATDQAAHQPTPTFSSDVASTPGMPGMGGMPMTPSGSAGSTPTAAAAPAGPNEVNIDGFAFAPATLTVKAGTTVTGTTKDEEPHTEVDGGGAFRSQALGAGATYSFTFPTAGMFDYVCSIHPFMHGTVVVTA